MASKEIIKDGKTGLLANPKDTNELSSKIVWFLKNKEQAEKIKKIALKEIEKKYDLKKVVRRIEEIYLGL